MGFYRKIQGAFAIALLSVVAHADDRYNNPEKQVWEHQAKQYAQQAAQQTTRAAELRARAQTLKLVGADERAACFSAHRVTQENYLTAREDADTFNASREAACGSCKASFVWTNIAAPVKTCTQYSEHHSGMWTYKAAQAGETVSRLTIDLAATEQRLVDVDMILKLGIGAELKEKYTIAHNNLVAKSEPLERELHNARDAYESATAQAKLQKTAWTNCLEADVKANMAYQKEVNTLTFAREENDRLCSLCNNEQRIVAKPVLSQCQLTGVGEALEEEAEQADALAARLIVKQQAMLVKVNGSSITPQVYVTVDPSIVNRWTKVEDESGDVAEEDHQAWHQTYTGTASDQNAHEDMHQEQATEAKSKRDKACGSVKSAEAEMNALVAQSTSALASQKALLVFAAEKTLQSKSRAITTIVQRQDCLARSQANTAANDQAKKQAKPRRQWECVDNFCSMKTRMVHLRPPTNCSIWTEELASSWRTEASQAEIDAAALANTRVSINAKVVAFEGIIKDLTRSCIITNVAYEAARIRLQRKWSETVRIMDLPVAEVKTESYWDRWARERVEATKFIKTSNVVVARSLEKAQLAAKEAVAAMRAAAAAEAEVLYIKMQEDGIESDYNVDIDFQLDASRDNTKLFEGAWFQAWAMQQAAAQKAALAAAKLELKTAKEAAAKKQSLQDDKNRREFMKMQAAAKRNAIAQILEYKRKASIQAKQEIARFVEIAEMEVRLAEAKAKNRLIADEAVRAEAEKYTVLLMAQITKAKEEVNKDKLRWTTTFALPSDLDVTWNSNYELNWDANQESSVVTEWLPSWWTKMVLDQKSGNVSGSSVTTSTASSLDGVIPSSIDMGWTTVKETKPSTWRGPELWAGWNAGQKDFHSTLIAEKSVNPTRAAIIAKVRAEVQRIAAAKAAAAAAAAVKVSVHGNVHTASVPAGDF